MKIKNRLTVTQKHNLKGLYFLLPFYLGLLFFFIEPIIQSIIFSFSEVMVDLTGYKSEGVGFENYLYALNQDEAFKTTLFGDVINLLWKTPTIIILSLFLAILINKDFKGRTLVRAIFFLPVIFSNGILLDIIQSDMVVESAVSATSMLDAGGAVNQSSGLNELLLQAGFSQEIVGFATTLTDSFFSLIWNSGIQIVIFLSGLQSIPGTLYEAASVEGASGWDIFCKITVPMLSPMIILNLIYTIVDSYSSTSNGVIGMILKGISLNRFGTSSAMAWMYFLVIAVILGVIFLITKQTSKPKKIGE